MLSIKHTFNCSRMPGLRKGLENHNSVECVDSFSKCVCVAYVLHALFEKL